MMAAKVGDFTLAELLDLYQRRTAETYYQYREAIRGKDEDLKDTCYRRWAQADDCLLSVHKLLEMVRSDSDVT